MRRGSRLVGTTPAVVAFPMHGYHKMISEGFRTRDAHVIEWVARLLPPTQHVVVASRPEPWPRRILALRGREPSHDGLVPLNADVLALPSLRDRHSWWLSSLRHYRSIDSFGDVPVIAWNPLLAAAPHVDLFSRSRPVLLDLLDDWTIHPAFASMRPAIDRAYGRFFDNASVVIANSEGTQALAVRYGRSDVRLVSNGVDPDRFDPSSTASGRPTVGYVGKIGSRLDAALIRTTCLALPEVRFVFAGPVLQRGWDRHLKPLPNLEMLGDVHYADLPNLLRSFDVGWVPHAVGPGEVGGDVIKTYEYRAAALPVLATPIIGVRERPIDGVVVADASKHPSLLREWFAGRTRMPRQPVEIPAELTWSHKARLLMALLGWRDEAVS